MLDSRPGRMVRLLKDGYWDHTVMLEMPDGSKRVRKTAKADDPGKIWGVEALRREISFLCRRTSDAPPLFPPVLDWWDQLTAAGRPDIGYDIPFYADHRDASSLARESAWDQAAIDEFQGELAAALLQGVHGPAPGSLALSIHLTEAINEAWQGLQDDPEVAPLVNAEQLSLNGRTVAGLRTAWGAIERHSGILAGLDAVPAVQLHGDFFLENVLWAPSLPRDGSPRLLLIDPVSVAGVVTGPPLFDLVKYESYATGELLALRSEWVQLKGFAESAADPEYHYAIDGDAPGIAPFAQRDWQTVFRGKFIDRYGPMNWSHYHLIDGYFSIIMALNTGGNQRKARLLKALIELDRVRHERD